MSRAVARDFPNEAAWKCEADRSRGESDRDCSTGVVGPCQITFGQMHAIMP